MSQTEHRVRAARFISGALAALVFAAPAVRAQVISQAPPGPKANWDLYEKFSTDALRGVTYSTTITPRWIGETDSMFYSWRDHTGEHWYLVNAAAKTKKPLFDHTKLAAQLSNLRNRSIESFALNEAFTTINITKDHKNLRFAVDTIRYNWNMATETLTSMGRYCGAADSLMVKDEEVETTGGGGRGGGGGGGGGAGAAAGGGGVTCGGAAGRGAAAGAGGRGGGGRGGGGRGGAGGGRGGANTADAVRAWSPDSTAYVFAKNYNLFVVDKAKGDTIQVTKGGINKFSFAGGGRGGGGGQQDTTQGQQVETQDSAATATAADRPSRPTITWSPDSKAFYVIRTDNRGVKDLYLVHSLTQPRPTLETYSYPMPGEDSIPKPEMWTYVRGDPMAKKAPIEKWKDQRIVASGQVGTGLGGGGGGGGGRGGGGGGRGGGAPGAPIPYNPGYWMGKTGLLLRVAIRDRLQRNVEFIELNVATGATKLLTSDSKGDFGSLEPQAPIYVKNGGDFIWFSERDGWGHYYLYSYDGVLKRQLTAGDWRSDVVVAVDSTKRVAWFRGEGREPGENPYNHHLYRVSLDSGTTTLLDPSDANHVSTVSKTAKWVVDASSRIDLENRVELRDGNTGKLVMPLETTDLVRLKETGWKPPEAFQVLAADGVTPIYGNMWKPFDFDSTKKYPIIANVYPGPQTESVNGAFTPGGGPQQLAQLGFIVIQIGNRGGNPERSSAYQDFGYFDMRDYALADKKAGIEQLGQRHKWIDLTRVGIFGHSGGGFLTAAALLVPPYNEFFKVGVSESGNHDNNIYNNNWSEQYHGLKWVAASDTARLTAEARSKGRSSDFVAGEAIAAAEYGRAGRTGGAGAGRGGAGGRGGGGGAGGRGGGAAAGRGAAGPAATDSTGKAVVPDSVFWIYVPTNIDIAANLKGKLLLETGDQDNNVSPANTIRLINALILSGKRFDFMLYPGQQHAYGPMAPYAFQLEAEYFSEFLLGDRSFRDNADFTKHGGNGGGR